MANTLNKSKTRSGCVWNFIVKYKEIILFSALTFMALYARYLLLNYESGDYNMFLKPWCERLSELGGLAGLSENIGNYTVPYMTILAISTYIPIKSLYIIKFVSIFFDIGCAFVASKIVNSLKVNKKYGILAYVSVIFLPMVILNSAFWGQADAIYTFFALMSIEKLINKKYKSSFVFFGIAFSFKLQAVFLLPFFIMEYISNRKYPIYYYLIIPIVYVVSCLPAIIAGRPIGDCLSIYFGQATSYSNYLSLNFPGVYNLIFESQGNYVIFDGGYASTIGVIFTIAIFAIIMYMIIDRKVEIKGSAVIDFALLSVVICTYFLPHMHERYLFMGDLLAVAYLFMNKKKFYIPLGVWLTSLYAYTSYLFGQDVIKIQYVAILYGVTIVLLARDVYKKYFGRQ